MRTKDRENKFRAEPDTNELKRLKSKTWDWVPKLELTAGFMFISYLMNYPYIAEDWKAYLSRLLAIGIFYLFVSAIMDRIMMNRENQESRLYNLERRFTTFICDASLGRVEKDDLKRLAIAASSITGRGKKDDLSDDDFSLINRAMYFWKDHNGFEQQDSTLCISCKHERSEHSKDGTCPN